MPPADGKEARFELAPGVIRLDPLRESQSKVFRLTKRSSELRLGKEAAQVGERARRRCHWDAETAGDVSRIQRSRAVYDDAWPAAMCLTRHRHVGVNVNSGWGRRAT
jgi:hypothetical protein